MSNNTELPTNTATDYNSQTTERPTNMAAKDSSTQLLEKLSFGRRSDLIVGYAMVSASALALSAVCHFSISPEEAVISSRAPVT
ncbi:hypothetical protein PDJAM_G00212320 [Pangasius djambal]|uniref:Uncharacterized protein n=1 Tax=Pangasius djambal TaxID=1691987 RepID=A0ACC5Y9Z3_9TELE|nr:hypothetical protein [Pangasius djambal]